MWFITNIFFASVSVNRLSPDLIFLAGVLSICAALIQESQEILIVCMGVSTSPQKHNPLFFDMPSLKLSKPPCFRQFLPIAPKTKNQIFQ